MDSFVSLSRVFSTPTERYHHSAFSSVANTGFLGELMHRRRFSTSLLISLALHAAIALTLGVVVVHERAELEETFTAEIVTPVPPKTKPRFLSRRELVQPLSPTVTFRTTDASRWETSNFPLPKEAVPTKVFSSGDEPSSLLTAPLREDIPPTLNIPLRPNAPVFPVDREEVPFPAVRPEDSIPTKPDQPLAGLSSVLLTNVEEKEVSFVSPEYLATIRKRIERFQRYPRYARENGIEGTTVIQFTIRRDGHLEEARVLESSGSKTLDEAALTAIREAAPFDPFPQSQSGTKLHIQLPIVFRLTPRGH